MEIAFGIRRASLRSRMAAVACLSVLGIVAIVRPLLAHEHGTLKLASKMLTAGDSLPLSGEKFEKNDGVTILLVGVAGRITLGDVPTDSAGRFHRSFLVPGTAKAGAYRLVAESVDGDEVASLDVMVLASAAPAPTAPVPGMEHMRAHEGMDGGPTGAPLALARARATAVTTTAIGLIIVCGVAGAWLLRGARTHPLEDLS